MIDYFVGKLERFLCGCAYFRLFHAMNLCSLSLYLYCRCVKYSLPNIPDFETLFVQTQEFINSCNGEQVRYATDSCKYFVMKC